MMAKLIVFAKKWTLPLGMLAAVAKRNRTPVKNKENRLCNTEL